MIDPHDDHESPIKTPKQLIVAVLAALLVPIIIIVLLIQYVVSDKKVGAGSLATTPERIAEATVARISPVANEGYTFKDATGPKVLQSGDVVYKAVCAACHESGAAGAPKFADVAAWKPRIAQGYDKLVANAINGVRAMPAKGGNPDLDDAEVTRAVVHMANVGGAKFKEPEVKAVVAAEASTK